MLVGGQVVALRVLLFGRWCLLVFCGVSGGNAMINVSRTVRTLVELMSLFFNTPYIWIAAFLAPFVLSFHEFIVLFSLSS
jgi:hypothetical protein